MENREPVKKSIVITSIYPPTEAVVAFSNMTDYNLIVVGDKKTPANWQCNSVEFLSVDAQNGVGTHLNKVLPFNHYCRKMLGYVKAIADGAAYIVDTDDDNIPKEGWAFPEFESTFDYIPGNQGFINVYQLYTDAPIWPRGLPLDLITTRFNLEKDITTLPAKVGMWQGLADEDPDVDAIYRLTNDTPCYFNSRPPIVLGKGTISPFNTQNTMVRKELFPLLYLPTYVTFRFTDILRGFVAQPIMWLNDYHLGFLDATVVQKRNPHDYVKDFMSEVPMYQHCRQVMEITSAAISSRDSISDNLYNVYGALHKASIVEERELPVLEAWLKDIPN
jgi:hypothetical protein